MLTCPDCDEDVLRYAVFNSDRETAHSTADTGEALGINTNATERMDDHLREKGRRGLWVSVQDCGTARDPLELGKGSRAAGVRTGSLGAPWTRADADQVKEQTHLVHEVQLRISRAPEAHVMALSLLVLLSDPAVKGCPAEVGHEATLSVAVKAPDCLVVLDIIRKWGRSDFHPSPRRWYIFL